MEMRRNQKCVAFPYYFNGELVNVKYRGVHSKEFHQVSFPHPLDPNLDDL